MKDSSMKDFPMKDSTMNYFTIKSSPMKDSPMNYFTIFLCEGICYAGLQFEKIPL